MTGRITSFATKFFRILRAEGFAGVKRRVVTRIQDNELILDRSHHVRVGKRRVLGSADVPSIIISKALENAQRWCVDESPDVSIVIINWNATHLTLECVRQIWANTENVSYEIIIVDNGSDPQSIAPLKRLGSGARLIELGTNRFFGEANNIGAEQAIGKYLCFLNNDAFVLPGWLRALVEELIQTPEAGAVGPMFLFPNNTLQEAGGSVDANGYPTRFGRKLDPATPEFNVSKFVDYVSAAAMVIEKRLFIAAGGFDLAYEPAYYEDIDLCFKLLTMGRKTRYCATARVIHIEGASANRSLASRLQRRLLGAINRDKFTARWGSYLKTRHDNTSLQFREHSPLGEEQKPDGLALPFKNGRSTKEDVAIYTAFALTPGGGERYIFTLAAALANSNRRVTIVTSHPYSHIRLQNLGRDLDVDMSRCNLVSYEKFVQGPRPDFMFTLGNHIVPPVPAQAANSWYQCQFPFPIGAQEFDRCRGMLTGYRGINVYSDYVRSHVLSALQAHNLQPMPVEIVSPPVPMIGGDASRKKNVILNVGRFFTGGHTKRQDLMIAAFRNLIRKFDGEVELHFAGSSIPERLQLAYLDGLKKLARHLPVFFHTNPTREELWRLYREAAIYWHATGMQCDLKREPEKAEHFGISIVVAMSAECVPLAFDAGGPREVIANGINGFLFSETDSLVDSTIELLHVKGAARRIEIGRAAGKAAKQYTVDRFSNQVRRLVETASRANSSMN